LNRSLSKMFTPSLGVTEPLTEWVPGLFLGAKVAWPWGWPLCFIYCRG